MANFQTVMQSLHFLKLTLSLEVRNTHWKEKIMWCKLNKWEKLFAFLVSWVLTYHHQWDPFGFLEMYSCKNLDIVTFFSEGQILMALHQRKMKNWIFYFFMQASMWPCCLLSGLLPVTCPGVASEAPLGGGGGQNARNYT